MLRLARPPPAAPKLLATNFEVHSVFGRKSSTPIPAVPVEDRRNHDEPTLHEIVAARVQLTFNLQVDCRPPGMIADCGL